MSGRSERLKRLAPLALFVALACLLLWPCVFGGDVFWPAHLLRYMAPWTSDVRPPWNPLHYDSIGQFYPWRDFAARSLGEGVLPLWNPHQFSGTPFVANSQSAVFYPGNLLHWMFGAANGAAWTALLHLALAGWFTSLFLRRIGCGAVPAMLGGVVFAFSAWQVSWLQLPTFLNTSAWLPLVLLLTLNLCDRPRWRTAVGLGFAVGMTLLAGHLQIAFYVLLAAGLLAVWRSAQNGLASRRTERPSRRTLSALLLFGGALGLGGAIAGPQLLPSMELSRISHRAVPPSAEGYRAYTAYAVGVDALATLVLPDFYGNPSNVDRPYVGLSRGGVPFNYAEGALYVGLPTLILAAFAFRRARGRADGEGHAETKPEPSLTGFLAALAVLSLLIALGTAVDALFYFLVPGFAQSGSPGRSLVLWAFALGGLAAVGLERLMGGELPLRSSLARIAAAVGLCGLILALGITMLTPQQGGYVEWQPQLPRALSLLALAAGLAALLSTQSPYRRWLPAALLLLTALDLQTAGLGFNRTAPARDLYPRTALVDFLRSRAGHDRILPVNRRGFSFAGPDAVLPPNGAMALGLRDIQGYDSLFPGQYKAFMNALAAPLDDDASPLEVGNMVFGKNWDSPLVREAGVRWVISQDQLYVSDAISTMVDGHHLYELKGAPGRARFTKAAGGSGAVTWLEDSPNRVRLRVEAGEAGRLTLADQYLPGWEARVDGRPAEMVREGVFRAVDVPAGARDVEFQYNPAGFRVGQYLMLAALAGGAWVLGYGLISRSTARAGAPSAPTSRSGSAVSS